MQENNDWRKKQIMERKYKLLTEDTIIVDGRTLYRIEAVRDFGDVKKGDKGGYIEKEENLSHKGDCWIYELARVYGNAEIYDDASVCGEAQVYGRAWVYDNALVVGNAKVYGDAQIYGLSLIHI